MKEILGMMAKAAVLGLVFLAVMPLAAVLLLGEMGQADSPGLQRRLPLAAPAHPVKVPDKITVWIDEKNKTERVDFEDYVCRVTASEMPAQFEEEALKAQSVAARTFAMSKIRKYEEKKPAAHPAAPICNTTHCQVCHTEKELISAHGENWKKEGFEKIRNACRETEGQLLYYEGELVMQPLFFSSSGGQTENSEDVFVSAVPYLVSVSSPYEEKATHREEEVKMGIKDFAKKLRAAYPERNLGRISRSTIKILSRTAGGRVEQMQAGDGTEGVLKGTEVRMALGLPSALFSIAFEKDRIVFTSSGSGHGVGMSQYGADGMAREGYDYREILAHYYTGVQVY